VDKILLLGEVHREALDARLVDLQCKLSDGEKRDKLQAQKVQILGFDFA
jgi:hypothetical protein